LNIFLNHLKTLDFGRWINTASTTTNFELFEKRVRKAILVLLLMFVPALRYKSSPARGKCPLHAVGFPLRSGLWLKFLQVDFKKAPLRRRGVGERSQKKASDKSETF
jgi:hypothetical protein